MYKKTTNHVVLNTEMQLFHEKNLMMSGKALAFLPTWLFQLKAIFTQRLICSQGIESDVFCVGKMQQHEAPAYGYDLDTPEEHEM